MGLKRLNFEGGLRSVKEHFVKPSPLNVDSKPEINFRSFKIAGAVALVAFIGFVLFTRDEESVEFSQKIDPDYSNEKLAEVSEPSTIDLEVASASPQKLWASKSIPNFEVRGSKAEISYNTNMIVAGSGNAKTQLAPGIHVSVRLPDKTIVSSDSVPVLAIVERDSISESGLKIPAGSHIYGEATFQKGSTRARVNFHRIAIPSGVLKDLSGIAIGSDGQIGLSGKVISSGVKNTAGSVVTTFVSGFASGSQETGVFGESRGGLKNGALNAVALTAKDRAQAYGEKMKEEKEWIEIPSGTQFDLLLTEAIELQPSLGGGS